MIWLNILGLVKSDQNTFYPRFGFIPKTGMAFLKMGFCFYCDWVDESDWIVLANVILRPLKKLRVKLAPLSQKFFHGKTSCK